MWPCLTSFLSTPSLSLPPPPLHPLSIFVSFSLFIFTTVCLSVCLSQSLPPSVPVSPLSMSLSVCLSICLSVCLSVSLCLCLRLSLFPLSLSPLPPLSPSLPSLPPPPTSRTYYAVILSTWLSSCDDLKCKPSKSARSHRQIKKNTKRKKKKKKRKKEKQKQNQNAGKSPHLALILSTLCTLHVGI